jgi:hypothetical protein
MASGGEPFSLSYFLWMELRVAADDAQNGLPFAAYMMFVIERVTRYTFNKDAHHEPYRGERTHHAAVGEIVGASKAVDARPSA